MGLRLLDHLDHAAKGGVRPHAHGAHPQAAKLGDRCGINLCPRPRIYGDGLAGDGRLVDGGMAGDHLAVDGDQFARADDDYVADLHGGDGQLDFFFALLAGARDTGGLGCQGSQLFDRAAGALGRELFGIVADAHKEDDDGRSRPLADGQGGHDADGHQRVRGDLAPGGGPGHVGKDWPAGRQHQQGAGPERDQGGYVLKQSQPLARHHDKEHGAEEQGKEGQHAPGEVGGDGGARRIFCGYLVAGALDGLPEGGHVHQVGIQPYDRLFGTQQHVRRGDTRHLLDRMLHVEGALGAVHALDGELDCFGCGHCVCPYGT